MFHLKIFLYHRNTQACVLDGVRFCQIKFIVYENPLCVTAWIISSNFSAISYDSCRIVSAAVKATLYVGNFQHVI